MKKNIGFRTIFHYYWQGIKKYPFSGIGSILAYTIGIVLADIIAPLIYKELIDIISEGFTQGVQEQLTFLVGIFFILALGYNILFRIADFLITYFQSNVLKHLADLTFDRIHQHSYAFFADNFSGALVTKAKRFLRSFEVINDQFVFAFVMQGTKILGALIVMFIFFPLVGLVYLCWLLLYFFLIIFFVRWKLPYDKIEAEADSLVTARYADTITNALVVKMFASKEREEIGFQEVTKEEERKRRKAWNMHNIQMLIQGFLFFILEFSILVLALWMWSQGKVSVGTVVLLQIYVIATFGAVWHLGRSIIDVSKAFADAREMVEIFETGPGIRDPEKSETCQIKEGRIRFEHVSFAYEKDNQRVFEDFSLSIGSGEKIGLVGKSGAGKSTITKILLRFADVNGGSITIDGQDIRDIRQDDLRRHISYVPQEPLLFHRSIRENIAYGRPEASDEEIQEVAKKAHAHEFISCLPRGYDTLVGERGVKLSGGERQRIAIARAMLKDAPILILDEATSSLDSVSEFYIQEALDELMKGKTVIVVAHRLSTIQKMDRIVVLEQGKIVEMGTHNELLSQGGVYARYWGQQSGGFLSEDES